MATMSENEFAITKSDGLEHYRDLWRSASGAIPPRDFPGWPDRGIAILGDFAGIQNFVLRPSPGAGGAARRLRSRSFRVSAYTQMVAYWCLDRLAATNPRLLYSAGGRFLMATAIPSDWRALVDGLQAEIDAWAWKEFEGELIFHLAAADFSSGSIPSEILRLVLEQRKCSPLSKYLLRGEEWTTQEFFRASRHGESRCSACASTLPVRRTDQGEDICYLCSQDEENGRKLVRAPFARIAPGIQGDIEALGLALNLHDNLAPTNGGAWLSLERGNPSARRWPLLRHVPSSNGNVLDFDQIALCSLGSRKWLGYLRLDVDHAGMLFAHLNGDPLRVWALSHFLNEFFATMANDLLVAQYSNLYSVYGGGDDLLVIGPWSEAIDFAVDLRSRLRELVGDKLSFSAGLALAKPREHVLTKAREAANELDSAKHTPGRGRDSSRNQIRALEVSCGWEVFPRLLERAKQVKSWLDSGELTSRFLHQTLELHAAWNSAQRIWNGRELAPSVRYRPLLYYQITRNLKAGPAREWAHSLLRPPSDWPWVDFIIHYAMLASGRDGGKGD